MNYDLLTPEWVDDLIDYLNHKHIGHKIEILNVPDGNYNFAYELVVGNSLEVLLFESEKYLEYQNVMTLHREYKMYHNSLIIADYLHIQKIIDIIAEEHKFKIQGHTEKLGNNCIVYRNIFGSRYMMIRELFKQYNLKSNERTRT